MPTYEEKISYEIPHMKIRSEIINQLEYGFEDFVLMNVDYKSLPELSAPPATKKLRETWGADIGFEIRGNTIKELMDIIDATSVANKESNLIYFICKSPEIGRKRNYIRINSVEQAKANLRDELYEL